MSTLEQQGFEIVPDCLQLSDVDAVTVVLDHAPLHRSRAGMRNVLQVEAVHRMALEPSILKFARSDLGQQALPFRATLFDKSPDSNWLIVWHQDSVAVAGTTGRNRMGTLVGKRRCHLRACPSRCT